MLIAEELAILVGRPGANIRVNGADLADVLAGGLLVELALERFVGHERDATSFWGRQFVTHDASEPPADPRLVAVWDLVAEDPSANAAQRKVARISRDLILDSLCQQEIYSKVPRPLIGPTYRLLGSTQLDELKAPYPALVLEGAAPDDRQKNIIWLLNCVNAIRPILGIPLGEYFRVWEHVRNLGKPTWPAKAAISAIESRRSAAAG